MPTHILTDNGTPFASCAVGGLSRLSIWWTRLGIEHKRIEPGRPDQNGRHERMHKTLKAEATKPPEKSFAAQQRRFARFVAEYNYERPHEALGNRTPSELYEPSTRIYRRTSKQFTYPKHMGVRTVDCIGRVRWLRRRRLVIGLPFTGERIGFEEVDEGLWNVWLGPRRIGIFDDARARLGLIRV